MDKEAKGFHITFILVIVLQIGLVLYCTCVKSGQGELGMFSLVFIGIYIIVMLCSIYSLVYFAKKTDMFHVNASLLLSVLFSIGFLLVSIGDNTVTASIINIVVASIEYLAATRWYWANEWRFQAESDNHNLKRDSTDYTNNSQLYEEHRYCPYCGSEYLEGAKYCNKCGKERN